MRLELAGTSIRPDPLVLRFDTNKDFAKFAYIGDGYTNFEVICIGAGGGMGGGIDTQNTGTLVRNYGGAGGGGGFHRVRGLLSALPTLAPVVVGVGGAVGNEHISDPASTTDGADGGYSSFNGTTCRASGGKGGKRSQSNSITVTTQAHGGEGGIGDRTIAGGGAAGGISGIPGGASSTKGADGTLFNNIGKGGGGGAGGISRYDLGTTVFASVGGRGSYHPNDLSVYGPAGIRLLDAMPGGASGAKAAPLNGLPTVYGQSRNERLPGNPGIVFIRLTAE